jgi:hypothetical protein
MRTGSQEHAYLDETSLLVVEVGARKSGRAAVGNGEGGGRFSARTAAGSARGRRPVQREDDGLEGRGGSRGVRGRQPVQQRGRRPERSRVRGAAMSPAISGERRK